MGERISTLDQEFERVVETRRIGLPLVGDRPQLLDVVAEEIGGDRRLARRHPVHVAAQRVDLAVVRDVAIGMSQLPRWERVCRKSLMHEGERGGQTGISQIIEIVAELTGQQKALVNDRPRRHRHGIIAHGPQARSRVDGVRDRLAKNIKTPFEDVLVHMGRPATDEELPGPGLRRDDALAEHARIDRHVAPTKQDEALRGDGLVDDFLDVASQVRVFRKKQDADRVIARPRQLEAVLLGFGHEEIVRNLQEHAAAVSGLRVGSRGAAMVQIEEDLQPHLDDVVRLGVVHVRDETHAAGVVLLGRIVKALGLGQSGVAHDDVAVHAGVGRRFRRRRRHDLVARLVRESRSREIVSRHHTPIVG